MIDLVVVGGALGASWGGPVGWAAFLYGPRFQLARKFVQATQDTPQEDADLLPFVAALTWFAKNNLVENLVVLCCSDSKTLVAAGEDPKLRSSKLWRKIQALEQKGFRVRWLWQAQEKNPELFDNAEQARQQFVRTLETAAAGG